VLRLSNLGKVSLFTYVWTPANGLGSWGCFRLTDPPGKQAILNCSRPGIFHPHDVDNIYTEALKPGHVVELTNAPLEIVDMRPKKKF
jgi:STAM-binding protein